MKFRTVFQDRQTEESVVKCLSQGHNRMALVGLNGEHVNHNHGALNHLTTLLSTHRAMNKQ